MDTIIHNTKELEFAIFCIENTAKYLNLDPTGLFETLSEKTSILKDYIIKNYETLHTQGKDYIIEDIIEIMQEKGCLDAALPRFIP
ncbi:MAG: DUF3791 domain-containing protein [Lachnospiraceae bacterium]|nr:DUF3791 domain-containing protein [Lachnospiraceae bacterium]